MQGQVAGRGLRHICGSGEQGDECQAADRRRECKDRRRHYKGERRVKPWQRSEAFVAAASSAVKTDQADRMSSAQFHWTQKRRVSWQRRGRKVTVHVVSPLQSTHATVTRSTERDSRGRGTAEDHGARRCRDSVAVEASGEMASGSQSTTGLAVRAGEAKVGVARGRRRGAKTRDGTGQMFGNGDGVDTDVKCASGQHHQNSRQSKGPAEGRNERQSRRFEARERVME